MLILVLSFRVAYLFPFHKGIKIEQMKTFCNNLYLKQEIFASTGFVQT